MSEIYIDSLTLENFGPFYGEHVFNFGNLDGCGGILVGDPNGLPINCKPIAAPPGRTHKGGSKSKA